MSESAAEILKLRAEVSPTLLLPIEARTGAWLIGAFIVTASVSRAISPALSFTSKVTV